MKYKIGAHVSINGGYQEAIKKAGAMSCNTIQMFAISPMARGIPTVSDEQLTACNELRKEHSIDSIYFHASYLVNFADNGRVGAGSQEMITREMIFASRMGVKGSIIHLGSFKQQEIGLFDNQAEKHQVLIKNIKNVIENTPHDTYFIAENAGNRKIGRDLEELARIVNDVGSDRLRICLDTCHLYSAGYDVANPEKTDELLEWFDSHIGLDLLEVIHFNDSRDPLASFRDRHENIGKGTLGLETFRYWINHPRLAGKPFILEVPGADKKGPDKMNVDIVKGLVNKL